jgi:two-component system, OmpR family, KDP operon response regulator KdpE
MESLRPVDHILIVDDEPSVLHLLEIGLSRLDCELRLACSSEDGLAAAREVSPVLVLLDILLPGIDGYEVCRRFRQFSTEPVILLTALRDSGDMSNALAAGADEFIAKPFSVADLLGRCRAALGRRLAPVQLNGEPPTFAGGRYAIDAERRLLFEMPRRRANAPGVVPISNTGFRLVTFLAANKGRKLSYADVLEHIWGAEWTGEHDMLRAHLSVLRQRLEPDPSRPRFILDDGDDAIHLAG